jgi:hypothetical protein
LKARFSDARLVVGNSEVGIEMKFKDARYPVLIGVTHVPGFNALEVHTLNTDASFPPLPLLRPGPGAAV